MTLKMVKRLIEQKQHNANWKLLLMKSLVCPQCKRTLKQDECTLICENCKKSYPIEGGVFNFIGEKSDYWGEVPAEFMEKINSLARKHGFEAALGEVTAKYPDLTDYLLNSGRIDWIFHCLNLKNNYSCLDLGSGWDPSLFPWPSTSKKSGL